MTTAFHLIIDAIKTFSFLTPQQHQVLFDTLLENVDLPTEQKFDLYSDISFDEYVSEHNDALQEQIAKILTDPNLLDVIQQIAMKIVIDAEQNIAETEKQRTKKTIGIERTNVEHIDKSWENVWKQLGHQSPKKSSLIVGIGTSQYHIILYNSDGEQISIIERNTIPPLNTKKCSTNDYVQEYKTSQNEYIDCRLQSHDMERVRNKLVELELSPVLLIEHSFSYPVIHEIVEDMRKGAQYLTKRMQTTKESIFELQLESNWNDMSFDDREMQMMQLGHQKIYISYIKFHQISSSGRRPKNMLVVGYMNMEMSPKIAAQAYQQERISLCSKWHVFYNHKLSRPSLGTFQFQKSLFQESPEESHTLERELIPRIRQTPSAQMEERNVLCKTILLEDIHKIDGFEHKTTFVFDGMIRIQPTLGQSRVKATSSVQMQNYLNFRIAVDDQIEHIQFYLPIPDMIPVQRNDSQRIIPKLISQKDTISFLENSEPKDTIYDAYFCKDIPIVYLN